MVVVLLRKTSCNGAGVEAHAPGGRSIGQVGRILLQTVYVCFLYRALSSGSLFSVLWENQEWRGHSHPAEKCLTIRPTSLPSRYTVPSAMVVVLLRKTSCNSGASTGSSIHGTLFIAIEARSPARAVPKWNMLEASASRRSESRGGRGNTWGGLPAKLHSWKCLPTKRWFSGLLHRFRVLLYFAILIIIIIKAVVFARIEQRIVHLKVRKARRTPPLTHYPIPHLPQITTHRDVKTSTTYHLSIHHAFSTKCASRSLH